MRVGDESGRPRILLGVDEKGRAQLMISDKEGHARAWLLTFPTGSSQLSFLDKTGGARLQLESAEIGAEGDPSDSTHLVSITLHGDGFGPKVAFWVLGSDASAVVPQRTMLSGPLLEQELKAALGEKFLEMLKSRRNVQGR